MKKAFCKRWYLTIAAIILTIAAATIPLSAQEPNAAALLRAQIIADPDSHPMINCGCTFTAEELDAMFLKKQVGYGASYIKAQQETGVCPLWNAAIDAAESGHFMHLSASHNVAGFGFDGERYMDFESIEACIAHKSLYLQEAYLTPGGTYYHGTSISAVNICYNGSEAWKALVVDVALSMLRRGSRQ